ncbi:mucoidy inhibitor MuiA [Rufibacter soli]
MFLNRAQVTNTGKTTVEPGVTELVLEGLPTQLDERSVQVNPTGSITLLSVRYEQNFMQNATKPKDLERLEDSLESYNGRIRSLNDQREVLQKEEALLQANQNVGGTDAGITAARLKEVADFYRTRLLAIKKEIQLVDARQAILRDRQNQFNSQVNQFRRTQQANNRVIVAVQASARAQVGLEVSYMVFNAGWEPIYDLRASGSQGPVQLQYKANVRQNTGVNWNNVQLTLATTNPAEGAQKPELDPQRISILQQPPVKLRGKSTASMVKMEDDNQSLNEVVVVGYGAQKAKSTSDFTQAVATTLAAEFKIGIPFSVPSDGKPHTVDIQQHSLTTSYAHMAVPKLDPTAFLVAYLTNWENLKLLPGQANVFLAGTFTGKSFLNPEQTRDTLTLSLGRDQNMVVQRERMKDYQKRSTLGSNVKEQFGYEISLRNTKAQPVTITIEDQIPVSTTSEIEVEDLDTNGGKLDKETGKVTWQVALKPNETVKRTLKYVVKYPKNKQVAGI